MFIKLYLTSLRYNMNEMSHIKIFLLSYKDSFYFYLSSIISMRPSPYLICRTRFLEYSFYYCWRNSKTIGLVQRVYRTEINFRFLKIIKVNFIAYLRRWCCWPILSDYFNTDKLPSKIVNNSLNYIWEIFKKYSKICSERKELRMVILYHW